MQWEAVVPDTPEPMLHSSSVIDLFSSVNQTLQFLLTIQFDLKRNVIFFFQQVKCVFQFIGCCSCWIFQIISLLIEFYVDELHKSCLTDIEKDAESSKRKINWKMLVNTVKSVKSHVRDSRKKLKQQELQQLGLTITKEVCFCFH